jgi:hypothetical protein
MKRNAYICTFLATGAVTAAVLSSSTALANYSNKHAVACMAFGGAPVDLGNMVHNASTVAELHLLCDAPDDTAIPGHTIAQVHAYGVDGNNNGVNPIARNCSAGNTPSFACGAAVTTVAATGQYDLVPPIPASWNAIGGEYRYTQVIVPRSAAGVMSALRGVFITQ